MNIRLRSPGREAMFASVACALAGCGAELEEGPLEQVAVTSAALVGATTTTARPEIGQVEVVRGDSGAVALCTATLVGYRHVLTSAHCLFDYRSAEFVVDLPDGTETRYAVDDYRLLGVRAVTAGITVTTSDGYVADMALLQLASTAWGRIPVAIADALPASDTAWSTRFGYGLSNRDGGGGGVKRYRSFQGLTSDFAANGDSGGPVLHGYGVGATPLWGVVSKIKRDLFSTRDWDANAAYFKHQIEGTLRNWSYRRYDENIDRPGGTYLSVYAYLPQDCEDRCRIDGPRCVAWTLINRTCDLKEVIPNWVPRFYPSSNATSGLNPDRDGSGNFPNVGWDLLGGDYTTFETGSHAGCVRSCARDERCRAFATVPRAEGGYTCHLKDTQPPPYRKTGVRAAVKRGFEMDTDRWGSDLRSLEIAQHAPERCQAECAREGACRAWSFRLPRTGSPGICYLKDAIPAPTGARGIISGRRGFEFY